MNIEITCKHEETELKTLDSWDVTEVLGAPFDVHLHDCVEVRVCLTCGGHVSHLIPSVGELASAVGVYRAIEPRKLSGAEIRFLRKSVDTSARDMAGMLRISAEQFSRYENDRVVISEASELLFRMAICVINSDFVERNHLDVARLLNNKSVPVTADLERLRFDFSIENPQQNDSDHEPEIHWKIASSI